MLVPPPPINVEIDKEMYVHCWQHCSTSEGEYPKTFATDCGPPPPPPRNPLDRTDFLLFFL